MKSQVAKRMNVNLTKTEVTVIEELLKNQNRLNEMLGNSPNTKNNASDVVRYAIIRLGYDEGLGDKM